MTTATFSSTARNHDNTWMKTTHDYLISLGLVQTSDTGQVSMSTAPAWVATASTNYGYTVYGWNDTLQGTYPLFMKIVWMNSADTAGDSARLDVTLGTGTNGAGTVTGPAVTASVSGTTTSQLATTYPSYLCYSNSALVVSLFESDSAQQMLFAVDRMRDADGTANAHGAVLTYSTATLTCLQRHFSIVSGTAPAQTAVQCFVPYPYFNTVASLSLSDDIPVFGHTFLTPHANHLLGVVTVPQGDIAADTVFTITRLGGSHTYRATGTRTRNSGYCPSAAGSATPTTASDAISLAYLYE